MAPTNSLVLSITSTIVCLLGFVESKEVPKWIGFCNTDEIGCNSISHHKSESLYAVSFLPKSSFIVVGSVVQPLKDASILEEITNVADNEQVYLLCLTQRTLDLNTSTKHVPQGIKTLLRIKQVPWCTVYGISNETPNGIRTLLDMYPNSFVDNIYLTTISPALNVIPTIEKHASRNKNQIVRDAADQNNYMKTLRELTGDSPITLPDGETYTIRSRNTYQSIDSLVAAEYIAEYFEKETGLETELQVYDSYVSLYYSLF